MYTHPLGLLHVPVYRVPRAADGVGEVTVHEGGGRGGGDTHADRYPLCRAVCMVSW